MKLPAHVQIRESLIHPAYFMQPEYADPLAAGYQTHIKGVDTAAIVSCFRGGDSVSAIAKDYDLSGPQVEAAIRWESFSRSVRVACVRAELARIPGVGK